jgi:endonuclease/exonuclease/phosphatase family metal-dependent hydrolase
MGFILDFAAALAGGRPLILAGDFNVVVGLREPGQRPSVSRGERELLERLREEFNLVPCWQTAHPGEPLARTLRWLHRSDSLPYHCDGVFVPGAWAFALQSCEVLEGDEWCALSDHNPVVATLAVDPLMAQPLA